jgi:benzoate membrane transport protein
MAAAARTNTPGEIVAGCLLAGAIMTAMALVPRADQVTRLAPMPVVMGVYAGSSIGYITGAADAVGAEPLIAGAPIAGYVLARALRIGWLPPVAGALAVGLGVLAAQGDLEPLRLSFEAPAFAPVAPAFSIGAALTLALPLVVLSYGLMNLQAYSILERAGYEPPRRPILVLTGLTTMLHGIFAAPPAAMQKQALAIMTSEDACPLEGRWLTAVVASVGAIGIAFTATSIAAFVAGLPVAFIAALMGVVLLPIILDATRASFSAEAGMGGALAFFVAASSFELWGIGAPFWGLVVGAAALRLRR